MPVRAAFAAAAWRCHAYGRAVRGTTRQPWPAQDTSRARSGAHSCSTRGFAAAAAAAAAAPHLAEHAAGSLWRRLALAGAAYTPCSACFLELPARRTQSAQGTGISDSPAWRMQAVHMPPRLIHRHALSIPDSNHTNRAPPIPTQARRARRAPAPGHGSGGSRKQWRDCRKRTTARTSSTGPQRMRCTRGGCSSRRPWSSWKRWWRRITEQVGKV